MNIGTWTSVWLALVVFQDPDACHDYVIANRLQEALDWQCILIEPEERPLAPVYSLRPAARPTNLGAN